jgi:hypothetical protein
LQGHLNLGIALQNVEPLIHSQDTSDPIIGRYQNHHADGFVGFLKANSGTSWTPSSRALLLAQKKFGEWEDEAMTTDYPAGLKKMRDGILEATARLVEQNDESLNQPQALTDAERNVGPSLDKSMESGNDISVLSDPRISAPSVSQSLGTTQKQPDISNGTQSPFRQPFKPPSRIISGLSRLESGKNKFKVPFKGSGAKTVIPSTPTPLPQSKEIAVKAAPLRTNPGNLLSPYSFFF